MNRDKLDKITITEEEVDELFSWKDDNKDLVRNFNPVLKNGCIVISMKSGGLSEYVFEDKGDYYKYTVFMVEKKVHEMNWNKNTKEGKVLFTAFKEFSVEEYNESIISLHATIMAYMEYWSNNKEYVEVEDKRIPNNKKSKGGKKKKGISYIKRKVYKVTVKQDTKKRKYERYTEKWNVRGHWRHYKNGKKVWIEQSERGVGKKVEPKNYKL